MPVKTYTVRCLQNRVIAENVHEFIVEKPEGFTFKPGQFTLFDVPLVDAPTDIQTRAFSLASLSDDNDLLFVIKLKPGGRATRWLTETVKEGDTLTMKGPFGFFHLDVDSQKDVAFLCTGAGIAPFIPMIRDAKKRGDTRKMDLIFGVRNEQDLFWKGKLEKLSQQIELFKPHIVLSQPSDAWTGHRGRIQHVIPQILPDIARRLVYVCGNPDMTTDVKKLCLEEWAVPKEDLHVEGYI